MGSNEEPSAELTAPSAQHRAASRFVVGSIGFLSKAFLGVFCKTDVHGLDNFTKLLDERRDIEGRQRGLLTVSNHLSVVDDPVVWGVLPFRHLFSPNSMRWSLGSEDICFKGGPGSVLGAFFTFGQTLPTHRNAHSPYGGLFQPTMTQSIRLLSNGPFEIPTPPHPLWPRKSRGRWDDALNDPFSDPNDYTVYSTTQEDAYPAPAAYGTRRHAWVHIFPEGRVHQHPQHGMRYFKWGAARLILESEPCPDVVPMFIEGFKDIMPEDRGFPRPLPRVGAKIDITFGERVSHEVFESFRKRWQALREKNGYGHRGSEELNQELMTGKEAMALRTEVALRLRDEIVKLRRQRGYTDEDAKTGVFETWREEGSTGPGKKQDDSLVGET